jgi:hypothetical protein
VPSTSSTCWVKGRGIGRRERVVILPTSGHIGECNQRVGRVLSFFSSRQNWDPPPPPIPHLQASVPPLPHMVLGGRAHSLAREGLGESQFQRGDIPYTVVLFIYTYFVSVSFPPSLKTKLVLEMSLVRIGKTGERQGEANAMRGDPGPQVTHLYFICALSLLSTVCR